jgi:cobalt-zinc-cadmium resistance protein CzcA
VTQPDTSVLAQNPSLAFANQQRQIGTQSLRLEKSRWLPGVTAGYFNQSLRGTQLVSGQERTFTGRDRFTGFQLGLALPLWFAPQNFRVRAAQSSLREADAQARLQAKNLQGQYREALEQYRKFSQSLAFYQQSALRNAELLVRQGGQAFRAGNIGYVEYAQALTRALALRQTYLTVLSQYNQAVLTLEFLQGSQPVADGR